MEQLKNSTNFINCGSTVPGNVADILLIFPEKACRGNTRHTKRGPDTQFLCVVLPTPYRTHHIMPPKKKKRGGGFTTTTAAAASAATASAAATSAAAAPSAEPYFGASGAPTAREIIFLGCLYFIKSRTCCCYGEEINGAGHSVSTHSAGGCSGGGGDGGGGEGGV